MTEGFDTVPDWVFNEGVENGVNTPDDEVPPAGRELRGRPERIYAEISPDARSVESEKRERSFPDRYVVGDRELREWLEGEDMDVEEIISVERLRRENPKTWVKVAASCQDQTTRAVLFGLVEEPGMATYDDLTEYTCCTRRTLRKHVYDLRDEGLVKVVDGRPAFIGFPDEATKLLVTEALNVFYEL